MITDTSPGLAQNMSDESDENILFEPVNIISTWYQIFIIVVGFIGNTVTIVIFSRTKQTPRKTSFFLISLALNDILCLLTVLGKLLDQKNVTELIKHDIACKIIVYLNMVFNFISCGIVLIFTVQRLCSICFPLSVTAATIQRRSKLLFVGIILLGFLIYTPILPKFSVLDNECSGRNHTQFIEHFLFFDSIFTLVIPFLGLLIMNAMIIRTLRNSSYNFVIRTSSNRHFYEPPNNNNQHNYCGTSNNNHIHHQTNGNPCENISMAVDAGLGLAHITNDNDNDLYAKTGKRNSILKKKNDGDNGSTRANKNRSTSFKIVTKTNNNLSHFELEPLNHSASNTCRSIKNDSQKKFSNSFHQAHHTHHKYSLQNHHSNEGKKKCDDCFGGILRTRSESSSICSSSILVPTVGGTAIAICDHQNHHHQIIKSNENVDVKSKKRSHIIQKSLNSDVIISEQNNNQVKQKQNPNESLEFINRQNSSGSVFEVANDGSRSFCRSSHKDKKRRSIFVGFGRREKKNSEDHFSPNMGHHTSGGDSGENTTNNNSITNNNHNNHDNNSANKRRATTTAVMNGGSSWRSNSQSTMGRANSFRYGGRNQSKSVSRKITKMLILVSSIFLLLNFPIHSFNVYIHVRARITREEQISRLDGNIREIFCLLFYTSFSCNFLLYSISGVTFRSEFKRLLFKLLRIKNQTKR